MEKNINVQSPKKASPPPFFSVTNTFMAQIEEALRNGEKIEFVSFTQWQKKHNLNITANRREFRPLGH
jgi:nucleoid DNA-binding protein